MTCATSIEGSFKFRSSEIGRREECGSGFSKDWEGNANKFIYNGASVEEHHKALLKLYRNFSDAKWTPVPGQTEEGVKDTLDIAVPLAFQGFLDSSLGRAKRGDELKKEIALRFSMKAITTLYAKISACTMASQGREYILQNRVESCTLEIPRAQNRIAYIIVTVRATAKKFMGSDQTTADLETPICLEGLAIYTVKLRRGWFGGLWPVTRGSGSFAIRGC